MEEFESFDLPEGSTDSHIHVFGPEDRYPYDDISEFKPADALPSEIAGIFAQEGIERAVLIQATVYGHDNNRHLDGCFEVGVQAKAVVSIDPDIDDAALRSLHERGARAVRIFALRYALPDMAYLEQIARKITPFGWHLQMLVRPEALPVLQVLAGRVDCPIVIDHLGFIDPGSESRGETLDRLIQLLATGKVYVKLAAYYRLSRRPLPYDDLDDIVEPLVAGWPDRILWGSDWPHPNFPGKLPSYRDLLRCLYRWVPDPKTRERILVENPARLFGRQS